jgi:DNA-binding FrmR family transcriptional regulator
MRNIILAEDDTKQLVTAVRRIIGQLKSIETEIEKNNINDQTFTQLLAVKGGASKICKEIISRGVIDSIQNYSREELDKALDIIFKLD